MSPGLWLRVGVIAVVGLVLQVVLVDQVQSAGVHADLMVVLAAAAGAVFGSQRGAVIGFLLGMLADLGVVLPFGLSALAFSLLAYAVGLLPSLSTGDGRLGIEMAVCVVAAAGGTLLYAGLGELVGQHGMLGAQLLTAMLAVTVGAVVLAPPALAAMRWAAHGVGGSPAASIPPGGSALS